LRIYSYSQSTKALGPYNRFALWVAGCPFRCNNCMTPDAQSLDSGYEIDEVALAKKINETVNNEGLTITGGEPFIHVKSLNILLDNVSKDLGIVVYTGFTKDELIQKNCVQTNKLLSRIDILIDGQYVDNLNINDSLKGSSNQNIYQLTDRYENVFDQYYNHKKREVEIYLDKKDMMLVGIPTKNTLNKINNLRIKE